MRHLRRGRSTSRARATRPPGRRAAGARRVRRMSVPRVASRAGQSTRPRGRSPGENPVNTSAPGVNTSMLRMFPCEPVAGTSAVNGLRECVERLYRQRPGSGYVAEGDARSVIARLLSQRPAWQPGPCGGRLRSAPTPHSMSVIVAALSNSGPKTGPTERASDRQVPP